MSHTSVSLDGWSQWAKEKDFQVAHKAKPTLCYMQNSHLNPKQFRKWKQKDGKDFRGKDKQKKARVAILIYDKVEFRLHSIKQGKEGHSIMRKAIVHNDTGTVMSI